MRRISSNTATTLTLYTAWATNPDATSTYSIYDGIGNVNAIKPVVTPNTATYSGNVIDFTGANAAAEFFTGSSCGTVIFENNIAVPNGSGGQSSGVILDCGSNGSAAITMIHNTQFTGATSSWVADYASVPGMIVSYKSNLFWALAGNPTSNKGPTKISTPSGGGGSLNYVAPADADYNACWNCIAGSQQGNAYNIPLSVQAGPDDVNMSGSTTTSGPNFVDPTRNFLTWCESLGLSGLRTTVISACRGDLMARNDLNGDWNSAFNIAALVTWVTAGFAPQNVALHNTAADGTDIGAVPYSAPATSCSFISSRPRIYLNNPGYGSYATVLAIKQAAAAANSTEWQASLAEATMYLSSVPSNQGLYDSLGEEMAAIYNVDKTTYAAEGARAVFFLNASLQYIAPTVDITAATNANPTVFTTATTLPFSSSGSYSGAVSGGTGAWAVFNSTASGVTITYIDTTHFSIAVDSTSFGAYPGNMTVSKNGLISYNAGRWDSPLLAEIWDWAHDQLAGNLTSSQINEIENTLVSVASYDAAHPQGWTNTTTPWPTNGISNLFIGPFNGAMQITASMSGDVTGMDTLCTSLRSEFLLAAPIYSTGATGSGYKIFPLAAGGAYAESSEYGPEATFYLLDFLETVFDSTGESLYSDVGTFPADVVKFLYYDFSPQNTASYSWPESMMYGDILYANQHKYTLSGQSRQVLQQDATYLCSIGDTTDCEYAEWWLQNVLTQSEAMTQGLFESPGSGAASEFLFYDPTITAVNPESGYGNCYLASGLSMMFCKSDWTSTSTWVFFKGGAVRSRDEAHFHPDVLNFNIYRNGDWLTNDLMSWGGSTGSFGRFENMPLPETSQYGTLYEGADAPSNPNSAYAWGGTGMTSDGSITQHEFTSSYAYAEADATTPFNGQNNGATTPPYTAQITHVIRDFLYLEPDLYVVQDRLVYSASLQDEWNIQSLGDPGTPTGNNFTLPSLSGSNALNVDIVAPSSPTLTVVTPATQITESNGGCSASGGCANQWRIEVSTGISATSNLYFVVMQSGASGFTPIAVTALTATNAVAAEFSDYVIGGMTDESQTGVTRSYDYTPKVVVQHIFMGLAPSTAYKVDTSTMGVVTISDGGAGQSLTTTSGGLLEFTTIAMGSSTLPGTALRPGTETRLTE